MAKAKKRDVVIADGWFEEGQWYYVALAGGTVFVGKFVGRDSVRCYFDQVAMIAKAQPDHPTVMMKGVTPNCDVKPMPSPFPVNEHHIRWCPATIAPPWSDEGKAIKTMKR